MNRTREKLKTVLICLLLVGMAYLTYSVWFYDSPFGEFRIEDLFNVDGNNYVSDGAGEDIEAFGIRPLSIAVRSAGENKAILCDSVACDEAYKKLRAGVASALRHGKEIKTSTQTEWEDALSRDGVFFDYRGNVPVEAVKLWLGEENGGESICGRYFFFATAGKNINVYIKNTDTKKLYKIETSVASGNLSEVFPEINAGEAEYARFCEGEEFSSVYPEMLIPQGLARPLVISSYNIYTAFQADTVAACLENFRLRDVALSSYSEKDGTQVYIADMVTLKLSPSGIVTYSDLRDEADDTLGLKVKSETENATFAEKCEAARSVVSTMAKKIAGTGGIYIVYAVENGDSTEIVFGRHVNGIPVDMSETSYFAKVIVKQKNISEVHLNLAGYESSMQTSEVLPERLAVAAVKGEGVARDLNLRYKEDGEGGISPAWFIGSIKKGEK